MRELMQYAVAEAQRPVGADEGIPTFTDDFPGGEASAIAAPQAAELALTRNESPLYLASIAVSNAVESVGKTIASGYRDIKERASSLREGLASFTEEAPKASRKWARRVGVAALAAVGLGVAVSAGEARTTQEPPTPVPEAGTAQSAEAANAARLANCAQAIGKKSLLRVKVEYADRNANYARFTMSGRIRRPAGCKDTVPKVSGTLNAQYNVSPTPGYTLLKWGSIAGTPQIAVKMRSDNQRFSFTRKAKVYKVREGPCISGPRERPTRGIADLVVKDQTGKKDLLEPHKSVVKPGVPKGQGC